MRDIFWLVGWGGGGPSFFSCDRHDIVAILAEAQGTEIALVRPLKAAWVSSAARSEPVVTLSTAARAKTKKGHAEDAASSSSSSSS